MKKSVFGIFVLAGILVSLFVAGAYAADQTDPQYSLYVFMKYSRDKVGDITYTDINNLNSKDFLDASDSLLNFLKDINARMNPQKPLRFFRVVGYYSGQNGPSTSEYQRVFVLSRYQSSPRAMLIDDKTGKVAFEPRSYMQKDLDILKSMLVKAGYILDGPCTQKQNKCSGSQFSLLTCDGSSWKVTNCPRGCKLFYRSLMGSACVCNTNNDCTAGNTCSNGKCVDSSATTTTTTTPSTPTPTVTNPPTTNPTIPANTQFTYAGTLGVDENGNVVFSDNGQAAAGTIPGTVTITNGDNSFSPTTSGSVMGTVSGTSNCKKIPNAYCASVIFSKNCKGGYSSVGICTKSSVCCAPISILNEDSPNSPVKTKKGVLFNVIKGSVEYNGKMNNINPAQIQQIDKYISDLKKKYNFGANDVQFSQTEDTICTQEKSKPYNFYCKPPISGVKFYDSMEIFPKLSITFYNDNGRKIKSFSFTWASMKPADRTARADFEKYLAQNYPLDSVA